MDQIIEQIQHIVQYIAPVPWLRGPLIISIALIFGKIIDWIVKGILSKLVSKTKTDIDDKILTLLHRPIFLAVLLIGLGFAT